MGETKCLLIGFENCPIGRKTHTVYSKLSQKSLVGEVTDPRENLLPLLCLLDIMSLSNCLTNIFVCLHSVIASFGWRFVFAVDSSYYRDSQLIRVLRITDC